ncbi:MAG: Hpt domain-containing protein [Syntrophomonadaceae bacterium]|nr:Hpt domain-containing protein [Syntrophomonadaceae bacterium]
MKANESILLEKLNSYGADTEGAVARFMGDTELYASCLLAFVDDPCFAALQEGLSAGNYDQAFRAAHTLKGVAGNLGLTPLYQSVGAMAEMLRTGKHERLGAEHNTVLLHLKQLEKLLRDG